MSFSPDFTPFSTIFLRHPRAPHRELNGYLQKSKNKKETPAYFHKSSPFLRCLNKVLHRLSKLSCTVVINQKKARRGKASDRDEAVVTYGDLSESMLRRRIAKLFGLVLTLKERARRAKASAKPDGVVTYGEGDKSMLRRRITKLFGLVLTLKERARRGKASAKPDGVVTYGEGDKSMLRRRITPLVKVILRSCNKSEASKTRQSERSR